MVVSDEPSPDNEITVLKDKIEARDVEIQKLQREVAFRQAELETVKNIVDENRKLRREIDIKKDQKALTKLNKEKIIGTWKLVKFAGTSLGINSEKITFTDAKFNNYSFFILDSGSSTIRRHGAFTIDGDLLLLKYDQPKGADRRWIMNLILELTTTKLVYRVVDEDSKEVFIYEYNK